MSSCAWWREGSSRSCGDADSVARVGGDEFGVLLLGRGAQPESEHVARLVCATMQQPFAIGSTSLAIAAATGLVAGGPEETSGDDLLRDAGLALSVAKAKGGSCCEVFSPLMHSSILEALRTEEDMRRALEREEFVVYYQPVVDLEPSRSRGSRPSSAGTIPSVASSVPTSSSPWQKRRGSSVPSERGSSGRPVGTSRPWAAVVHRFG